MAEISELDSTIANGVALMQQIRTAALENDAALADENLQDIAKLAGAIGTLIVNNELGTDVPDDLTSLQVLISNAQLHYGAWPSTSRMPYPPQTLAFKLKLNARERHEEMEQGQFRVYGPHRQTVSRDELNELLEQGVMYSTASVDLISALIFKGLAGYYTGQEFEVVSSAVSADGDRGVLPADAPIVEGEPLIHLDASVEGITFRAVHRLVQERQEADIEQ